MRAVLRLVRALVRKRAPDIRAKGIAPQGMPTDLVKTSSLAGSSRAGVLEPENPAGNLLYFPAHAKDHAGVYVFLASDQAQVIAGTFIHTDGGPGVMTPCRG